MGNLASKITIEDFVLLLHRQNHDLRNLSKKEINEIIYNITNKNATVI
jgi:hypothetical protein